MQPLEKPAFAMLTIVILAVCLGTQLRPADSLQSNTYADTSTLGSCFELSVIQAMFFAAARFLCAVPLLIQPWSQCSKTLCFCYYRLYPNGQHVTIGDHKSPSIPQLTQVSSLKD